MTISLVLLFWDATEPDIQAYILLTVTIVGSVMAAGLWACEYRRLKIARLIAENSILNIRTAAIADVSGETEKPDTSGTNEVFVSYFGILLDSKLIKFNQDGIRLMAVEFGPDYILLTYGTDKWMQSTRLLRPVMPREELRAIAEKFRYETGIVPDICC